MNTYNYPNLFSVGTVLSATRNSAALQLENITGYAIQIVVTGTPTGSFKLQSACDPVPKQNLVVGANGLITYAVTNWTDVDDSSTDITAAGTVLWNVADAYYTFVRVVYTDASSGASTAIIAASTFNAKGY